MSTGGWQGIGTNPHLERLACEHVAGSRSPPPVPRDPALASKPRTDGAIFCPKRRNGLRDGHGAYCRAWPNLAGARCPLKTPKGKVFSSRMTDRRAELQGRADEPQAPKLRGRAQ